MAHILITGANGFVGANLLRTLVQEGRDEVHAGIRPGSAPTRFADIAGSVHVHELNMADPTAIRETIITVRPEIVYHLAHYGGNRGQDDSELIRRVVIDGTMSIYTACAEVGTVRAIVNTGSSSEYGAKHEPMRENMLVEPNTEYGVAKVATTLYGEHLRREKGMPITTLRLFSVYGPYEASVRLVPASLLALSRGESPRLANPTTSRDFIHVDDVVGALRHAATAGTHGVYNVGTGVNSTLETLVTQLRDHIAPGVDLQWGVDQGRSFDTTLWVADMSHTRQVLGWSPKIPLVDGLAKTMEWFSTHKDFYI